MESEGSEEQTTSVILLVIPILVIPNEREGSPPLKYSSA